MKDHTGKNYGPVAVQNRTGKFWHVRWKCCGKEEDVTTKRVDGIARETPKQCRACMIKAAATKKQEAAATKKQEAAAAERATWIHDPWPALGRMGPR